MSNIYVVICRNDSEPVVAFTTRIDALNYAEELGSSGFYRLEIVEVELRKDYKDE